MNSSIITHIYYYGCIDEQQPYKLQYNDLSKYFLKIIFPLFDDEYIK